jgi:hypothetical protein
MVKTLQCDGFGALKFDSWAVVVVHMYVHTGKGRSQVYTSAHICITTVHIHVPCAIHDQVSLSTLETLTSHRIHTSYNSSFILVHNQIKDNR